MNRPKYQQNLRLAVIVLASAFILFAEPAFANKAGNSRKSGGSSEAKQQASRPAPAPRAPQQSNAGANRNSSPSSSRPSQPSPRSISSSSVSRSAPSRTPSVAVPNRSTPSRSSTIVRPSPSTNNRSSILGNIDSSMPSRPSSSTTQSRSTYSNQQINSRIDSIFGTQRTRPPTVIQQPAASSNNRISSDISSRIGNPIGIQPPSTSTFRNRTDQDSTNRVDTRSRNIFGTERIPSPTESQQPAASSNNRVSSTRSRSIGNIIGTPLFSPTRTSKQSDASSINRNRSIIDSVIGKNRTPPSNVDQQPAASSNNRQSSRDRTNSSIGSVIGPERTPPPNRAQQPAAGQNNRTISGNNRDSIFNTIGKQPQITSRPRKQTTMTPDNRGNSRGSDVIRKNISPDTTRREISGTRETITGPGTTNRTNGRANRKAIPDQQSTVIDNTIINTGEPITSPRVHRFEPTSPSHLIFRDRPYSGYDSYHYENTYVDTYSRIRRRLIWPRFRFMLCYNRGPWNSYRYFYPYYHRKYLFVSLDGCWPFGYRYIRYYWYGYHPYYWYGYYPIAREVDGDTYNYYTYNYYYDDNQSYGASNYDTAAEQPVEEPAQTTLADSYFDEAVKAFEVGNYDIAVENFASAMALAPDDVVLPFAYCQALLAAKQYSKAAEVLRTALLTIKPEKEGVFYPRGLYPNEETLLAQLDNLAKEADAYSFDADLQLLLGYQLLGIGDLDKAVMPLTNASQDLKNADAAAVLLKLLEKIKTTDSEIQNKESEEPQISDAGTAQVPMHSQIINDKRQTKIKETILFATLCVLAGSTGIGHYLKA
jgi:tetratricopeptide (TPR) repeat protein